MKFLLLICCLAAPLARPACILLHLKTPHGYPLRQYVAAYTATPDATLNGKELHPASVRFMTGISVRDIRFPEDENGVLEVDILLPPDRNADQHKADLISLHFAPGESEKTTKDLKVRLLSASRKPLSEGEDVAYIEVVPLNYSRAYQHYRFLFHTTHPPGKLPGTLAEMETPKGDAYTLEDLQLELILDEEGNLRQVRNPVNLLDIRQEGPDVSLWALYDLGNKPLPEKKDGIYPVPETWVPMTLQTARYTDGEDGKRVIRMETLNHGRPRSKTVWNYHPGKEVYDFQFFHRGEKEPSHFFHQTGSKTSGRAFQRLYRTENRGNWLYEKEFRWFNEGQKAEPIFRRVWNNGELVEENEYSFYEEGPQRGKVKTAYIRNRLNTGEPKGTAYLYLYEQDIRYEVVLQLTPKRGQIPVREAEPVEGELKDLLAGFEGPERVEEGWVWPELPQVPEDPQTFSNLGPMSSRRHLHDLSNEFDLETFTAIEKTIFHQGGDFKMRRWSIEGMYADGTDFRLSEESTVEDAGYADSGNDWTISERFSMEDLPKGVTHTTMRSRQTSTDSCISVYIDLGIWDPQTGVFKVDPAGPHVRQERMGGTMINGEWLPGSYVQTKFFVDVESFDKSRHWYQDTWRLESEGNWVRQE